MAMSKLEVFNKSRRKPTNHKEEQKDRNVRKAKKAAKSLTAAHKKSPVRNPDAAQLQMMFVYAAIVTLAASVGAAALAHPAAAQADDDQGHEYQPIGPQNVPPPMTDAANDYVAAKWVDSIKSGKGSINIVVGDRAGCIAAIDYFHSTASYVAGNGKQSFPDALAKISPKNDDRKSEYHRGTKFYATGSGAFNVLADRGNHPNLAAGLVDMGAEEIKQTMFDEDWIDPKALNTTLHHQGKAKVFVNYEDGNFPAGNKSASIEQIIAAAEQAHAEGENAPRAIRALPNTSALTIVITADATSDELRQAIQEKSETGSKTWAVFGNWSNPSPELMSDEENDFFQMIRDLVVPTINDKEWKGPDDTYVIESPYTGNAMRLTVANNTVTSTNLMIDDQLIPFDRNETKLVAEEKQSKTENRWAKNKNKSYTSDPNATAKQSLEPTESLTEPEKKSWLNVTQIKQEATRAISPYMKNPFNLSSYIPR